MLLPLRGVATPGHGEGEGSAVDKFRVSGTQETVEGAGANEVSGVLSEASCCRCGAPLIKKKRPTLFSRPHTALAVARGREYVVGFFGVMMRDRSAGLGTGVVTANIIRFV